MFKVLLGAWASASLLTGGLLMAVTQNPPLPDNDSDSRPAQDSGEQANAQAEREVPDDGVPREGDTTQIEQEAARDQRERRERDEASESDPRDSSRGASANDSSDGQTRDEQPSGADDETAADQESALPGATGEEAANELGIQFRMDNSGRLMVSSVSRAGQGEPGLREGDVIVSAGGRTFESEPALREFLMRQAKQDEIPLVVRRGGREMTVTWNRKPENGIADSRDTEGQGRRPQAAPQRRQASLGMVVVNSRFGPRVADVVPGSPADRAGLRAGDFIIRMNGQQFSDSSRLAAEVARSPLNEQVELHVGRGNERRVIEAQPQPYEIVYRRSNRREAVAGNERRPDRMSRMQQRQAARPDFDTAERVEQLESRVDALQRDLEQLRARLNAILGDDPDQDVSPPQPTVR